jgi:hypothetical protein
VKLTSKPSAGQYILDFGGAVTGHLIVVSPGQLADATTRASAAASVCGGSGEGVVCTSGNDTSHVRVLTGLPNQAANSDRAFYIAVI